MSEANNSLEQILRQLKCHFTWNLFKEKDIPEDLEERVCEQIESLNPEFKGTMYNLLAYIKHLHGQDEAALECLQQAEESIQQEHCDQAEVRNLVTWGNYAWVNYHLGRLPEAQAYVDKVKQTCEKFSNPFSLDCPELDSEEGWTWLNCGERQNERARVCFEKALEKKPNDPEFSTGLATAKYYLDGKPRKQISDSVLKKAIELNPDNQYVRVLQALKLQKMNKEAEGERMVKEAVEKAPHQNDVLRIAAKFYKNKGDLDKAIELVQRMLESTPNNCYLYHQIACCYWAKVKQVRNEESDADVKREKMDELRKHAKEYLDKAIEKGLSPLYEYSDLTELLEIEDYYEVAFKKELPSRERQHTQHDRDSLGQAAGPAVQCDLEGLPISQTSAEKEKVNCQQQDTSENQIPPNAPNYWYQQGLIHKMNGELLQAVECFEKELGRLLRNSPSGISRFFLPELEL
ncbi:interferon-induced protein with tetratricopeptide repeats 3 isoform X1 [Sorex araneus]|uniref:interferon-induced protein with tetratricopeptide repeats 3 isoform X1 n=2 Tax=Sorex araneus TaxID=42254 RepID=UPI002433B65B|nr:interferon-induced protein with tetratricopeptide repeats 3 isoform X1 [Sorex araneus]